MTSTIATSPPQPHTLQSLQSVAKLDLLLPQDLPTEVDLAPADQVQIRAILSGILYALAQDSNSERLSQLSQLLTGMSKINASAAQVEATSIPAKSEQVEDFDRYFNVNRVTSSNPAWPMVRSHLQTCVAAAALAERTEALPKNRLTHQLDGFVEYTHVLARVFQLVDLT